jgi:hypothetical protein
MSEYQTIFNNILNNISFKKNLNYLQNLLQYIDDQQTDTENKQDDTLEWLNEQNVWDMQIVKTKIKKYLKQFAIEGSTIKDKVPLYFNIIKKIKFHIKQTQIVILNLMKTSPGLRKVLFDTQGSGYSIWPWWTSMVTNLNIASKMIDYCFRNNRKILTLDELKENYKHLNDQTAMNILSAINKATRHNSTSRKDNWYEDICNDMHISDNINRYINDIERSIVINGEFNNAYDKYIEFITQRIVEIINVITLNPYEMVQNENLSFHIFLSENNKSVYFSEVNNIGEEEQMNYPLKPPNRFLLHWLIHEVIKSFTTIFRWKDLIQWVVMIDSYTSNSWMLDSINPNTQRSLFQRANVLLANLQNENIGGYEDTSDDDNDDFF